MTTSPTDLALATPAQTPEKAIESASGGCQQRFVLPDCSQDSFYEEFSAAAIKSFNVGESKTVVTLEKGEKLIAKTITDPEIIAAAKKWNAANPEKPMVLNSDMMPPEWDSVVRF